jgi:hypothetical protein
MNYNQKTFYSQHCFSLKVWGKMLKFELCLQGTNNTFFHILNPNIFMASKAGQPFLYEIFILQAYNYSDRKNRNGADAGYFNTLILSETDPSTVQHLKKTHAQFVDEIRTYLDKAVDKFLTKKKLLDSEKDILLKMKSLLPAASNSDDLYAIIEMSFPISERLTS